MNVLVTPAELSEATARDLGNGRLPRGGGAEVSGAAQDTSFTRARWPSQPSCWLTGCRARVFAVSGRHVELCTFSLVGASVAGLAGDGDGRGAEGGTVVLAFP